jgi:hypothetical protein
MEGDSIGTRLKHAWNVFLNRDPTTGERGYSSGGRPDRVRLTIGNERSIIAAMYVRIAIDVTSMPIRHVRVDQNDRYLETIDSGLNNCLSLNANADQTAKAFIQDAIISLFDEGCIALVPIDVTTNPENSNAYDINTMRVGKILEWYPTAVRVRVYNEQTGRKEEVTVPKKMVAIVENPLYMVMNEPNSTLQRLIRKLNILDAIDEQSGSGKLDLIIQLPYVIRSQTMRDRADARRKDVEEQLKGSKYGIAYTDGTEKITQLNRPAENNLMNQIQYLTTSLFGQLGITEGVFNGTADEAEMLNYYNRTVDPVISALVDPMHWKFLSKTAKSQGQKIMAFRDSFKLVPVSELAEIADKFTRNEILSSNEVRSIIGYKPSDDPKADELRNKNLNADSEEGVAPKGKPKKGKEIEKNEI